MKSIPLFAVFLLVLMASCKNNKQQAPAVTKKPEDTAKFYSFKVFLGEQIKYVDLRNFPLYKITIKDAKKDSAAISKEQFIELAGTFLAREASFSKIKDRYTESVFRDLTTGSINFNYHTTDIQTEVENIDILLDEQTQQVKRIFIRSQYMKGDTSVTEQSNWKADKSFLVNRTFTTKNGYTSSESNYINWNDKP